MSIMVVAPNVPTNYKRHTLVSRECCEYFRSSICKQLWLFTMCEKLVAKTRQMQKFVVESLSTPCQVESVDGIDNMKYFI